MSLVQHPVSMDRIYVSVSHTLKRHMTGQEIIDGVISTFPGNTVLSPLHSGYVHLGGDFPFELEDFIVYGLLLNQIKPTAMLKRNNIYRVIVLHHYVWDASARPWRSTNRILTAGMRDDPETWVVNAITEKMAKILQTLGENR
jgi:hypothetical protein